MPTPTTPATAQHTPGPWHVATYGEGSASFYAVKRGAATICRVVEVDPMLDRTGDANARLIAAAPDLLAAIAKVEARLTAAANAFYVSGKAKDLQAAFDGWKADAAEARAAIQRATA